MCKLQHLTGEVAGLFKVFRARTSDYDLDARLGQLEFF